MTPGRSLAAALVSAVVLAVGGWSAIPSGGDPAPVPAPPPSICRIPPAAPGWPGVPASGPVADLSAYQDYRAALGITDALTGVGVRVADVEYEWRADHVELASLSLPAPPVTGLPAEYQASDHGTAVLGVLGASPDGQGVTGLVPSAQLRPVSPFATGAYDPAGAVKAAAAGLGPGDVLLIELQAQQGSRLVPIESIEAVRDEIRAAVNAGIVVVEPAGNGGVDVASTGRPWLSGPGTPGDSGALMVGAGGSETANGGSTDLARVPGSNYGARVDVQGVGAAVVTSGYGEALGGSGARSYTACFDGTSSASATIAGAVAALQGGAISLTGTPLTPSQVRDLLVRTGKPQAAGEDTLIGPRPQVDAALADLLLAPPPPDTATPPPSAPQTTGPDPASPAPARPGVTTVPVRLPAATGFSATLQRRAGRLILRIAGLAPGSTVRVRGARVKVVGGRATILRVRAGRFAVRVTPPARLRATRREARAVVVVPAAGAVRILTG